MSILARYQNTLVEVNGAFTTGDGRKLATVTALEGQPFKAWSHGGWSVSDKATVPAELLALALQVPGLATVPQGVTCEA